MERLLVRKRIKLLKKRCGALRNVPIPLKEVHGKYRLPQ